MVISMPVPILTKHLLLDEFSDADFGAILAIADAQNRVTVKGYMPFWRFKADINAPDYDSKIIQAAAGFIDRAKSFQNETPRRGFYFAIRQKHAPTEPLGLISIFPPRSEKDFPGDSYPGDVGVFVGPNFGKNRYAIEAGEGVLSAYFSITDIPIQMTASPDNVFSTRVIELIGAEKIGFEEHCEYDLKPRVTYRLSKQNFENSKYISIISKHKSR